MNLMEDDASAKEAMDVKKGKTSIIKERNRSEKLLVFDVTTQSIRSHKFHLITKLPCNS